MPDSLTWEEAAGVEQPEELSWEDAAPLPDLSGFKPSPYQVAEMAAFQRGMGKPLTGMEPGTELTTALAGGALRAAAAVPGTVQAIADIPSRISRSIALGRGQYADMVPVGEERAQQAAGFGEAMTRPLVPMDILKAKVEPDDPAWAAAIKEAEGLLVGIPEFLSSPLGLATMGTGLGGKTATSLARYAFAGDMLKSLFDQAPNLRDNWSQMTPAQKGTAIADFMGTGAMGLALMRPEIQKARRLGLPRAAAELEKGLADATQERIIAEGRQPEYPGVAEQRLPAEAGRGDRPVTSATFEQAQIPQEGQAGVLLKPTVTETTPPVPQAEIPTGPTATGLRPAIRLVGGDVAVGEAGWTHPEIIDEYKLTTKEIDQRGFVDEAGRFYDREQAAQVSGVPTQREPGRQHSTDLPEAQKGFVGEPMPETDIWSHLKEKHGIKKGGVVEPYSDPSVPESGELIYDKNRRPIGIRINTALIYSKAKLDWVIEHEASHWFDLENPDITLRLQGQMPLEEYQGVRAEIDALGYSPQEITAEVTARSIQKLAEGWRARGWFDKIVGSVERFAAEKLGMKLTRRAAENTAVRAIAQSIKRISRAVPQRPDVSAAVAAWKQRFRAVEAPREMPSAEEILKASEDEWTKVVGPRAVQGEALTAKLAAEMTEPELRRAEPIIEKYLAKQEADKELLNRGEINVQEYINRVMEKGTKGKLLFDVFARLRRPLKAPLSDLPELKPGMVRLYHGEGGAEGAGLGGSHFSTDPQYVANFGPRQSYVDVPRRTYFELAEDAHLRGQPGDLFLPDEWVRKSKDIGRPLPPRTIDLDVQGAGPGRLRSLEKTRERFLTVKQAEKELDKLVPGWLDRIYGTEAELQQTPRVRTLLHRIHQEEWDRIKTEELPDYWRERTGLMRGEVPMRFKGEGRIPEGGRLRGISKTREMFLPPVQRGAKLERRVEIEVPEEARRLKITPLDIEWTQRGKEGAYRPISDAEAANPTELGRILTTDARIEGSQLPVSSTRRLVAMMDKKTGEVHIVSVYPHGRSGAMAVSPTKAGTARPNVPVADLLDRYKPLYTILRDSPVKNFHQRFDSLDDYMQRFGEEAGQRSQESLGEAAMAKPVGEPTIQPTYPGGLEDPTLPTDAELKAFHNFFEGEVPENKLAFDRLMASAAAKGSRQMADAVRKAFYAEEEANPTASQEVNIDSALSKLYEDLKTYDTRTGFVKGAQERIRPTLAEPIQERGLAPQAAAAAPTGARELTLPRFARRRVPAEALPTPSPRAEPAPALTPEERSFVAAEAAKKFVPRWPPTLYRQLGARQVPKERYRMRGITTVKEEAEIVRKDLTDLLKFDPTADRIAATLDAVDNRKGNLANQRENDARLASEGFRPRTVGSALFGRQPKGDPQVLAAANVLLESSYDPQRAMWRNIAMRTGTAVGDFDPRAIPIFRNQIERGRVRAEAHMRDPSPRMRRLGQAEMRAYEQYKAELDYAETHWNDPALQETARRLKKSYAEQFAELTKQGFNVNEHAGFDPHRYDAAIWNGHGWLFNMAKGVRKIIGERTLAQRSFDTYYHAFGTDAFLPVTRDSASLLGHYIRKTGGMMYREQWRDLLKTMRTPSGLELAADPKTSGKGRVPHKSGYEIVDDGYAGLSVHPDYARLIRQLVSPSHIELNDLSRGALHLSQALKHTLLVGDFFHLGRMLYYGLAVMGTKSGFRSGWTVLDIDPRNIPEAVAKGIVRQADADWANVRIPLPRGRSMTRRQIADKFYQEMGANLGRVQDALYKELVTNLTPTSGAIRRGMVRVLDPSVGRYNRFLFDRLTRGLMAEANVREFERQMKANPNASPKALMRDIARDVNNFFGNIGRQGWFKSRTMQDLSRILWLAPQWVEGLIKKEVIGPGRALGITGGLGLRRGPTTLGTTGRAIGRGMLLMVGITQAINLITRGKPTWMNEEKEHKFDAWIPGYGADSRGFWLSPLAIFNEVSHDIFRLVQSKPTVAEALTQIMGNKEQPVTRSLLVGLTGISPMGQKITTTAGRAREMGKAVLPVPISFGKLGQSALHRLAPSVVSPPPEGAEMRQFAATFGVKIEPAESQLQQTAKMAREFMEKEGLTKETGWQQIQTDQPGYSKLRSAIRNNDDIAAKRNFEALRKTRTDKQITDAMKIWAKRGFTGSLKTEREFLNSLSDEEMKVYDRANEEKQAQYEKWLDWYWKQE